MLSTQQYCYKGVDLALVDVCIAQEDIYKYSQLVLIPEVLTFALAPQVEPMSTAYFLHRVAYISRILLVLRVVMLYILIKKDSSIALRYKLKFPFQSICSSNLIKGSPSINLYYYRLLIQRPFNLRTFFQRIISLHSPSHASDTHAEPTLFLNTSIL